MMKHHTEMHNITVGCHVYEVEGCQANRNTPTKYRVKHKVVSVFGRYKDDYIQIGSKNSPLLMAGDYKTCN